MKVRKDQYNNDTDVTVHYQLIDVGNRKDEYQLKDEGITKGIIRIILCELMVESTLPTHG